MKLTTLLALCLIAIPTCLAQAPIQRTPWTTNITGNPVLGANNLSITNTSAAGTNWVFYGVQSNTVARLVDITNVTGNFVLKAGDTMTGSLTTVGLTNTGGFTNSGNAYVSGNVGIGTNGFLPILQVEGNRTGRAFSINDSQLVVTNGNVGIGTATPAALFHVQGTVMSYAATPTLSLWDTSAGEDDYQVSVNSDNLNFYNTTQTAYPLIIQGGGGAVQDVIAFKGTDALAPAIAATTNSTTYTTAAAPFLSIRTADNLSFAPLVAKSIFLDSITSTTGNARGQGAVDLQSYRSSATAVASGTNSFIGAGTNNTASGWNSAVIGGSSAVARLRNEVAHGAGMFSLAGDAQDSKFNLYRSTSTNTTPTTTGTTNYWNPVYLDGDAASLRLTLPYTAVTQTNSVWTFRAQIAANATTNYAGAIVNKAAGYTIEGVIKETVVAGTRTTALVGSPVYVAWEDDSTWDVRVTADDTNEALSVEYWSGDDCPRVVATVTLTQVTMAQ